MGAESTPLPTDASLVTNRQKVDAQTADAQCMKCHHEIINPTGFALEMYDAMGSVQTQDNGADVDSTATVLIGSGAREVGNALDLMQELANAPEAQECYARNWVSFAYQRALTQQDGCTAKELAFNVAGGDYSILELIADLTQAEQFSYRVLGPTEVTP